MRRPSKLLPHVWDCVCDSCLYRRGHGMTSLGDPVRNCNKGPDCPCHPCREEYGQKAIAYTQAFGRSQEAPGEPVPWGKIALGLGAVIVVCKVMMVVLEVLRAVVDWVGNHIGDILMTLGLLGLVGGVVWFLFLNPDSPLKKTRRPVYEESALPPRRQEPTPPRPLPAPQVRVLGVTPDKPAVPSRRRRQ